MNPPDTIAAIATGPQGSLSIIRMSGPDCLEICDKIFSCKGLPPSKRPSHSMVHGRVLKGNRRAADSVLLMLMRAPRSYTGEDVAEIQGHGGPAVTRAILRACLDAGCRPAEPGEFTKRAFLNGKMDLLQAEAVQDLIRAETDRAASAALEQLEGELSRRIEAPRALLLEALSEIEPVLDFPDDEMPAVGWDRIRRKLLKAKDEMRCLGAGWNEGRLLREGVRMVLIGPPNAGKSSIFNRLVGKERAIVSRIPGTTRDSIEESLVLDGYVIRLVDTAGLRETDCEIEREGVERSLNQRNRSDLVLFVLDVNSDPSEFPSDDGKTVVIINKMDERMTAHSAGWLKNGDPKKVVGLSAKTGEGMDLLKTILLERAAGMIPPVPHAAISERHRDRLLEAERAAGSACDLLEKEDERDLVPAATELRAALDCMDELTGRNCREDLLERIFSTFCIGK